MSGKQKKEGKAGLFHRLFSKSNDAQTEDAGATSADENVATYPLEGKTPAEFMRDNFGKQSMAEDEPDGEPTEQVIIEFEG